jgi:hypothetical protein
VSSDYGGVIDGGFWGTQGHVKVNVGGRGFRGGGLRGGGIKVRARNE